MFRAHVLIIRRSKLHYTASGIITPIGVMIPDTKFCASSWLNTEINILRCTVSKTSKKKSIRISRFKSVTSTGGLKGSSERQRRSSKRILMQIHTCTCTSLHEHVISQYYVHGTFEVNSNASSLQSCTFSFQLHYIRRI